MIKVVHRYEGTVNQVMGDGIVALLGAPLAHEDHAVRACYAALRMQDSVKRYAEDARHAHGVNVQIRVGLNSGEVVVRAHRQRYPHRTTQGPSERFWMPVNQLSGAALSEAYLADVLSELEQVRRGNRTRQGRRAHR